MLLISICRKKMIALRKPINYWQLFTATFRLSAFTFGGGYVIISMMRKNFVEDRHWVEEDEMLDMAALAQSAPGAVAINASVLVGYRLAGIPGAMVSVFGTVLPCLILLSVISLFYMQFKENFFVNTFMKGTGAGVAAVILDVVIRMTKTILKEESLVAVGILILSFAATLFFGTDVRLVIFSCGLLGLARAYYAQSKFKGVR